jgi:hypothetical protein
MSVAVHAIYIDRPPILCVSEHAVVMSSSEVSEVFGVRGRIFATGGSVVNQKANRDGLLLQVCVQSSGVWCSGVECSEGKCGVL